MKYLSLFSGIGTAEKGIEQAYERYSGINRAEKSTKTDLCRSRTSSVVDRERDGWQSGTACIGYAEIDRFAASIYKYHWPHVRNYGDATRIVCDELPDFDFLVAGFPCQSFSIAGKRQGFNEARGTLFFEIARILSHKRPRHFLLENVKGLLSSDDGKVYTTILRILSDLDYRVETVVLNSKHYGVPQNRERVFFIGHSSGCGGGEILSFGDGDGEFDEEYGDAAYCLDANYAKGCNDLNKARRTVDNGSGSVTNEIMQLNDPTHSNNRVYSQDGASPALNTAQGDNRQPFVAIPVLTPDRPTKRQNGRRMKKQGEARFTLTAQDRHGVMVGEMMKVHDGAQGQRVYDDDGIAASLRSINNGGSGSAQEKYLINRRIRRLTEVECERLQGLDDDFTKYGIIDGKTVEISSTQRYKTLGNAMTVNVISAVINKMLAVGCLK